MNSLRFVLLILVIMFNTGCSHYSGISGKVVDNATGKPIEGAVVVAQWTKARGWLGEQQSELHKIIETLTDKEGKFSLSGAAGFALEPPEMIIYKEGYIPWRNDGIFPDKNKQEHEWKNNVTYKLVTFTDEYTVVQLRDYLDSGIIGYGDVPIFHKISNTISRRATDYIEYKKSKGQKW